MPVAGTLSRPVEDAAVCLFHHGRQAAVESCRPAAGSVARLGLQHRTELDRYTAASRQGVERRRPLSATGGLTAR